MRLNCSKQELFISGLLDDALQQVDVVGESFLSGRGQGAGGQRTIIAKRFGHRDITRFLQSADVRCEIAIGHVERVAQFRKG